ncbi:MAG: hypothetical protein EBY29_06625 [Planctomycetes bacterium]|nr:hypothetical protein [Planctomycetota bacterium]
MQPNFSIFWGGASTPLQIRFSILIELLCITRSLWRHKIDYVDYFLYVHQIVWLLTYGSAISSDRLLVLFISLIRIPGRFCCLRRDNKFVAQLDISFWRCAVGPIEDAPKNDSREQKKPANKHDELFIYL